MSEMQAEAAQSGSVKVECVVSLRHDEDYICGRCYEISTAFLRQYPENFQRKGWREEVATQHAEVAKRRDIRAADAQGSYERARDHQEFLEVQAEVERARARKERAALYQDAADAQEREAQLLRQQVVAVTPPDHAPPEPDPLDLRAPGPAKTAGPNVALPRAERLRRTTA